MPNEALIFWIGVVNLVLGIAVFGVAAVLAYNVARRFRTMTLAPGVTSMPRSTRCTGVSC
jgi:hypothetical protein